MLVSLVWRWSHWESSSSFEKTMELCWCGTQLSSIQFSLFLILDILLIFIMRFFTFLYKLSVNYCLISGHHWQLDHIQLQFPSSGDLNVTHPRIWRYAALFESRKRKVRHNFSRGRTARLIKMDSAAGKLRTGWFFDVGTLCGPVPPFPCQDCRPVN